MTLDTEPRFFFFCPSETFTFYYCLLFTEIHCEWKSQDHSKAVTNIIFTLCLLNLWQFLGVDLWRQAHDEKWHQKGSNLRPSKLKVIARSHEPPPLLLAKAKSQYCVVLTQKLFIHRLFELEAPFCRRMFCRQTNRS